MTLHILFQDKFSLPFYHFVKEEVNLHEQQFLFIAEKHSNLIPSDNLFYLRLPIRKNILYNLKLFYQLCFNAKHIILHGDLILQFFLVFPFFIRKCSWLIYGQELYSLKTEKGRKAWVKKFVLSRVKNHITHIKGDSDLANMLLKSKANFVYSPMYLSNVVDTSQFKPTMISEKNKLKLLVGNSTDPTNNHKAIFEKILKYSEDIEVIYCPLSYGIYQDYKDQIKALGHEMFGSKFVPVENFMSFEEYRTFLMSIDIAIFNHNRQEAMGVTLTLMSLGKIIYMNSHTTSFESFTARGGEVYDIALIDQEGLKIDRSVDQNADFLKKNYSKEVYKETLITISKLR